MEAPERLEQILRCLVHIIGRTAMPIETVYKLVGRGRKQLEAFNLCDGSLTQKEVSKKSRIDQGNLSRTFKRWVQNGIAFWIGEGQDAKLLHIYPLPRATKLKAKKKKRKR